MTRIGLLSDTHASMHPRVFEFFKDVDQIWHAGDFGNMETLEQLAQFKPLVAVFGNIDDHHIRAYTSEYKYFTCEEAKVAMTHIGGYPGHYPHHIKQMLALKKPDIFVCGHSHILRVMHDKKYNLMYLNPGAAGNHGFHKNITCIRFSIEGKTLKDMEVLDIQRG